VRQLHGLSRVLSRHSEGIMAQRSGARPSQLSSGVEIDTRFRPSDPREDVHWLREVP
jgi:hypothetical protein